MSAIGSGVESDFSIRPENFPKMGLGKRGGLLPGLRRSIGPWHAGSVGTVLEFNRSPKKKFFCQPMDRGAAIRAGEHIDQPVN
jgi:hypothetical protein